MDVRDAMDATALTLSEEQVLSFRARRGHLVGAGAADVVACAQRLMGAQAQVEPCALYALSARTQGRPTAQAVRQRLYEDDHALVRTWGQRDTLHLYDARDWPMIIAARARWAQTPRRGGTPPASLLEDARLAFEQAQGALTRDDLFALLPERFVQEVAALPGAPADARRLAASRVIEALARLGHITFGPPRGSRVSYVHRDRWHSQLPWPALDPDEAARQATRRYLAVFGPASQADVAHHMGARSAQVRAWLPAMADELLTVSVQGRSPLMALRCDEEALRAPVDHDWPVRLLPAYDTALMAHKDKRWLVPDAALEPLIWRKAAVVAAAVWARGRIVGTWSAQTRADRVDVQIDAHSLWRAEHLEGAAQVASAYAAHLGRALGQLVVRQPS